MVKRPTGSGGEPSSPNCGASAEGRARHLLGKCRLLRWQTLYTPPPDRPRLTCVISHTGDLMKLHRFLLIAWPSAIGAALMEMLVFSVLDPRDIPSVDHAIGVSPEGVYTLAFFAFWAAISFACTLTLFLAQPVENKHAPI